ncbi:MAG TPA: hypothetical protein VJG32_17840 [Anaerolineae bacterium]|nr:hypothetical protein [Anaerolineae bacterium]
MKLTTEQQVEALQKLFTPNWAVKRKSGVAGGKPFTEHEYATGMLDAIFEPSGWSLELTGEYRVEELPNTERLISVPGKLTVTFSDGTQVSRPQIGVAIVRRTKDEKTKTPNPIGATPSDNYKTAYKASVTSLLKGCLRDLGRCFVPMQSADIEGALRRNAFEAEIVQALHLRPITDPEETLLKNKAALGRSDGDLVKDADRATKPDATDRKAPEPVARPANGARPYSPETLKAKLAEHAGSERGNVTPAQRGLLAHLIELCVGKSERYVLTEYLTSCRSTADIPGGLVIAMLRKWINATQDSAGKYVIADVVKQEAQLIVERANEKT